MNIQQYLTAKDNTGAPVTLHHAIETIAGRTGDSALLQQHIEKLRKLVSELAHLKTKVDETNGTEEYAKWEEIFEKQKILIDELKKRLTAVTWSGTFKKRKADAIIDYTQLICLDIDKLNPDELNTLLPLLKACQHTYAAFISPSGNGIKVLFKTAGTPAQHKDYFKAIEEYFFAQWQVAIDKSGKDICRLCFYSYDENLYYNEQCTIFTLPDIQSQGTAVPAMQPAKSITKKEAPAKITLNDIWESTQQVIDYSTGNRNNFVHKFACNANRAGITLIETLQFAMDAAHDLQPTEVETTVKSAYNNNTAEYGKFKKRTQQGNPGTVSKKTTGAAIATGTNNSNAPTGSSKKDKPDYSFWKEHKIQKGKGDNAYNVTRLELSRVDFCDFLFAKGFHLLPTGDEDGFQIVHSKDGIIKPINPQQVKHFALNWCRQYKLKEVEEMLRKGQKNYFAKNELDSLPFKEINIKRDTAANTSFYFQNCWVSIDDKGKISQHPYTQLQQFIWESNKIKHDYVDTELKILDDNNLLLPYENINCEFAKFVALASYNPNNEEEKNFTPKQITDRFFSFCSAIGYLLDGYKHPSNRLGIFSIDHKIGERNEANGRSGKSMIPQACKELKKVANIGGKHYDPKYQFANEPITVDTQIINFNDMQRNFDVENIFEFIADSYSVNRRNQGFIHFQYPTSPKVYYSTNFIPKGDGDSYAGRMQIIEFSDYFNKNHTPYNEFEHGFFDESWPVDEWQRFYNFMLFCVSFFKEAGFVQYPNPNFDTRKLVNEVVPEFIDWMMDDSKVPKNTRLEKIKLLDDANSSFYVSLYTGKLKPHTFAKWVKQVCRNKGLQFNPHKKGNYDKSNSVEYYTIANEEYKHSQQNLL